jgi:ABC-type glycerol-3-phosphate transport system substrate-binding protein
MAIFKDFFTQINAADPKKMSMFSYMEKNTNVAIKYIPVNENDIRERKTLALQSGDIPAAFAFTYNTFSDFELDKYSLLIDV